MAIAHTESIVMAAGDGRAVIAFLFVGGCSRKRFTGEVEVEGCHPLMAGCRSWEKMYKKVEKQSGL